MSYKAVILPKHVAPGVTLTDEALEDAAKKLREKGTVVVTDPEGDQHECQVHQVEVTERGIEATLNLLALSTTNTTHPYSMGCDSAPTPTPKG